MTRPGRAGLPVGAVHERHGLPKERDIAAAGPRCRSCTTARAVARPSTTVIAAHPRARSGRRGARRCRCRSADRRRPSRVPSAVGTAARITSARIAAAAACADDARTTPVKVRAPSRRPSAGSARSAAVRVAPRAGRRRPCRPAGRRPARRPSTAPDTATRRFAYFALDAGLRSRPGSGRSRSPTSRRSAARRPTRSLKPSWNM